MGLIVLLIIAAVVAGVFIANIFLSGDDRPRRRRRPAPPVVIMAPSGPPATSNSDDLGSTQMLNELKERWRREAPAPHVPYPANRPAPHHPARIDSQSDRRADGGDIDFDGGWLVRGGGHDEADADGDSDD